MDYRARLRSRKRKLSELYSATFNDGEYQVTRQSEAYNQKLRAFLEANDLGQYVQLPKTPLDCIHDIIRVYGRLMSDV